MTSALIPLAQGCEELEAVTIIDLLRRAKINVVTAGLDDQLVTASRGTVLKPDTTLEQALQNDYDAIILPGGLPGSDNLKHEPQLITALQTQYQQGKMVAAICAAPKVLAHAGLLRGKKATFYPGALSETELEGIDQQTSAVVKEGNIITSRGPGTAVDFALDIIETLNGQAAREEVETPLLRA